MAVLMYWKTLDGKRIQVLKTLSKEINLPGCYMAGGTALSLQMGLRKSYDFDFFTPDWFDERNLYNQLKDIWNKDISEINLSKGTCDTDIMGIQVSFFHYDAEMVNPLVEDKELPGIKMASPEDIAIMKLSAIGSRGAKKDFFDLYQIIQETGITTEELANGLYTKFGNNHNFSYIAMGLGYFEEARAEKQLQSVKPYDWKEIEKFFLSEQRKLFSCLEKCKQQREPLENIIEIAKEEALGNTSPLHKINKNPER